MEKMKPTKRIVQPLTILFLLSFTVGFALAGQTPTSQDSATAIQVVRQAVQHEVAAANDSASKHMFRSRKQTPQGSQTRLYVETRDAMVGMTIAYNDKPLNPDQLHGEENRLQALASSPEQLKHKHSQEQETNDRTVRIVKALPDAFLYEFDGEEEGTSSVGKPGDQLVRLKFRPNPSYHSPTHVEEVLDGMQGTLLIDNTEHRLARIDGTLFKEVSFGWGILGHLDKGGHFLVEQCDVGDGSWELSRMTLSFTGKILFFKSISIKSDEVLSNFRRVPSDTTFAKGVQILKAEEARLEQSNARVAKSQSQSQ